ncbi:target of Nesh-SH3 isoform X3 [Paramisgurnus dabryanus]|uniref:target of Nesh-SH3 isoform X3 n=1 Tax=Paramisgurnus dabryanus TaxID=90735 RepID=UPI0031F3F0A0
MQVFLFLSGIMLLILTSATLSKGQNLKVHISAFEDTIVFKFIRPLDNSRLDGYILGYGSTMFSKQLIHLPGNGEFYETEIDAEPKYLIAVQSVNPDKPKKECAGKVDLQKPLNIMIGSVTETSVLLSWGTLFTSPFMDTNMDDCFDDGQFTVRYREKEPSNTWKYQTCPTTSMVIDNLKPDAQYEFEVRPDIGATSGAWSPSVIHNTADEITHKPFEELNQAKLKNTTQAKPAPLLARTVLPEVQTTTEAEKITTDPIFLDDLPTSTQTPEFPHTSITLSTPQITSTVEHKELTSQPSTTPDQPITITQQALTTEHQPTTTYQPTTTHQPSTTQEEPTSTTQEEPTSTTQVEPTSTTQEEPTSTTQEEPTSTTQEEPTSTTQEQTTSTTQEQTTSTTQEETTSTTQKQTTSTTQEQTTSTTQEQTTSSTQEETTSTTQEQTTSTTQEQTTTTQVLTKEQQYTTRQQMIAAQQQFIVTTSDPIPPQTNPPPTKPPLTQQHTTSKVPHRTVRPSPPKEPDTISQDNRNTGEIRPKLRPPRPILHLRGTGNFRNSSSVPRPLAGNVTHKPRLNGRVSPNQPINSSIQRNSTNNRKRVPSGEHHKGLRRPKPSKVPRKDIVKQNTNQVPESTNKKTDIDLKQLDKLPLKPLAPPTTEKPTYQETPHYFNGSRFDTGDNSSVFSPVPVSKTDAMGKERFIAPHVVYKTDKRPEEPCSVTNSLSYFPEEEVGYINVTGPPKTPPSNLTVVTVEGCPSFVILDWEKTDNETTEYDVVTTTEGPGGKEKSIVTTNQTHTSLENLTPKSSYEFKVIPKNELGTGPSSDPVTFSTESADPRVSEIPTGKTAIWSSFPFKADSYTECNGRQFIKRTWYRKFVGIQLCNSLRYKIYLSDSLKGKFYSIGDQAGLGEDHCQFVDSYLDGRTGGPLSPNELPPRQGYFRAVRQEPVRFGEIGGNSLINYVAWYECGIPIPGKW